MKVILLISLIISPFLVPAQSLVFCPEIKVENRMDIEGNVFIIFKDSRTYEKKLYEKCSKMKVLASIGDYIKATFPKLNITVLDESNFEKKPVKKQITFKIDLRKYDATFNTGMYVSTTKFFVEIHDNRNGNKIYDYEFNGEDRQWNVGGYSSGKKASNNSFKRAFDNFALIFEKGIKGNLE